MTRSILLGAVAFATVATVPSVPVSAQDDRTIVIEGPRIQRERQPGSFREDRVARASSMVHYDDLALNTEYGRDVLRERVRDAAKETCDMLGDVFPFSASLSSEHSCVRRAVSDASDQIDAAIARHYYG